MSMFVRQSEDCDTQQEAQSQLRKFLMLTSSDLATSHNIFLSWKKDLTSAREKIM